MRDVFNFSAGPSMLPEEALLEAQANLMNYQGTGISVMEMSHRSKPYEAINAEAESLLREILSIPANYKIIFVQGGASTQFEAVPLNLLKNGKADYIVSGNFSQKAYKEAKKYGDMQCIADSGDKNYTYIPTEYKIRGDADYLHIATNNTIFGTRYTKDTFPKTAVPIVADMSSNILSEVINVSDYGVIYAGAQKNIGPAGVTVVIVREDLLNRAMPICPTMLKWSTQADENSLYNTPPCWSVYMSMLTFRWIKKLGGISAVQQINEKKAAVLYDTIDNSSFYKNGVNPRDRSIMNVPFTTPSPELDDKFVKEAAAAGLITLKGHRLVGGMRASIYNPMPVEGVNKLAAFMKKFENDNK